MEKTVLEKINKFTRRDFTEEELYVFSIVLCDNEIDRDGERFSDTALEKMKELFNGKTGISDHKPTSANQTARIFDTEIVTDETRTTKNGDFYRCLKGHAYMVRTDENKNLIAEIDGGIKKEVSISCRASRKCSVCGRDKNAGSCGHISGKRYGGRICHTVLDDVEDAYEWSFVAIPAQVNAGVTKKYPENIKDTTDDEETENLRRSIRRLAFFSGGAGAVEDIRKSIGGMNRNELAELEKAYERKLSGKNAEVQLVPEKSGEGVMQFRI